MNEHTEKSFLSTCIALFFAINFTGIGVALFIQANLGSDTITVFIDGLKNIIHTSLGGASRIYNIAALLIALWLSRKDIGWCTIVYALTVGYFMDFYDAILTPYSLSTSALWIRFVMILIGQLCFVATYVILILYRKGMNQLDAIAYGITNRCRISYQWIRTGLDAFLLVGGYVMGGVIGIGSILAMASTGILVNQVVQRIQK